MNIALAAVLGTLVCGALWQARHPFTLPGLFKNRTCQGASWRGAFPDADKQDIRLFLSTFVGAFSFREEQRLQFCPSDKILDVYRALYPRQWTPDSLELETLAAQVQRTYAIRLEKLWSETLTLGELFIATRNKPST